ncbi:gliding motility-associated C-terminal domain-containing protein [Winogradskyella sp. PG-2]|uniref:HYR-like domain-containing protein n=1 Tax=Winogradskyella sp. PG-2 TaxID=754409 RepID=UPI0004586388|nr:gliding motility-associated C-terminal domain-containing protein [Winogradskyella sp. PG-2]BAO77153.1 internalin, putative [Winogradskyella sp. PG-2]
MKNKYNCISVVNIAKVILIVLCVVLPNIILAQQSPSIQTGVTFQWSDTQSNNNDPATIQSVTIGGVVYNTFVVPTSYEMTRLGPTGDTANNIEENGITINNSSDNANWNSMALLAMQDKNLNHYFESVRNGRDICSNFTDVETTDAQKQTIFYSPAIPANQDGVIAITERGGNNCFYVEIWGIPSGGGLEQKLGETFVRNSGNYTGCSFAPPISGSDYWQSGRCNENGQTVGIGLFYLSDIAPIGSKITKIEFVGATSDHGDGKFFLLQKYAIDQQNMNCINTKYYGDLNVNNNVPDNSTYSLVSGPAPTGDFFELNSDGTYSYIPFNGFTGNVTFEYEVCLPAPNTGVCDRATATIEFVSLSPVPLASVSCGSAIDDFTISVTSPLGVEYEYALNNGAYQSSPIFNNLPEGSYTVNIRSTFTTCENINSIPITLDNLELAGTISDVTCKLDETGAIDITPSGGTPPYTYSWSNSATSQDLSNIFVGIYTVTVTDANGCTISNSFTINEPSESLDSTILSTTNVLCNGESTGEIDLTISGGTAPYIVLWNNSSTSQDQSNLAAGDYDVTITDANGCTTTNQATISEPNNALTASITDFTNVDCNSNSTGNITVEGSGGTPPYNYSIDGGTNNQTNGLFENLAASSYIVLVTDENNCTTTVNQTISEPIALDVSIANVNDVDCSGEATGDITITVSGGTQPYSYSWSNSSMSQNLTNVIAGAYSVTVTDANGCSVSANTTITEPTNPLSLNMSKIDANTAQGCINGEATADVSGGTASYTYLWSASASNQTNANATNLSVGTHSVTITDANGCTITQSIVIVCTNTCDAELTIDDTTNVLCVGDATGSGTISANSNANPGATFTFTWSNGQVDSGVTSSTINNITAGVYDVNVTIDGTVCQAVEETISITEPNNALNLTSSSTDELGPSTGDGTASATATGGVEPYTYLWSPGDETTQNISGLSAGNYTVTVTNANGCKDTNTVTVNPGTCNNLSISGTSTHVICNGESNGSVTAVVSNGVGPFTYSWDTLPDTTPSVSGLPAGNYTATVTDQTTLCTQNTTITINEPSALSSGIEITNILCKDDNTGFIDLTVNGGTSSYTFLWNTGATTEDLANVVAGTYSVTITDANGCTVTNQSTVNEPAENVLGSITQIVNVECLGESTGSITAGSTGGIPPYTYSLDNGSSSQSSGLFENLVAGNYTILITDANGCIFNVNGTIGTDDIESPIITVPATIIIEGCSTGDITNGNAVFAYSETQSGDIQSTFASNTNYNASDDFNIQSITYIDVTTSTNNCPITVLRTFTITDNCDNTATAQQTITVQDTTPPTLTLPSDVTIECTEDETSTNTGIAGGMDYCSSVTITESDVVTASCSNSRTIVRTWTATDACGNATSADQTITVQDTTPPTISVPADVTIECTEDESSANTGIATGADTCGDVTISQSDVETAACGNTKTIIRTWTATDNCGNATSADQTITVQDTTPPTISVPANVTIECTEDESSANTGAATGNDTCGDVTISQSDVETAACGNTKTIIRTWTATDNCGNVTSADQTITVQDTTPPTISVPADVTIECTEDESSANTGVATGNDTCGTITISQSNDVTTACGNTRTIIRTWTATDNCGNATSADQTITVQDTTPPTISVPADVTIECTEDESSANTGIATGADTCGDVTISQSDVETVTCGNTKTIIRTWTATDNCGNATSADQTINVQDTTPPTIDNSNIQNINIQCGVTPNGTLETWLLNNAGATASDTCGNVTWFNDYDANTALDCNNGAFTVTFTATDDCNNSSSTTATYSIIDTVDPVLTIPANVTIECNEDTNPTNTGTATAIDDCAIPNVSYSDVETATCGNTKTIIRTWTATDDCGNATSTDQTITVQDTTEPNFTVPADITIECDVDTNDLNITGNVIDEEDNCSNDLNATFTDSVTNGNCINESIITRTWSLTDECDNTTTLVQTITVQDSTSPTFTVPADLVLECDTDVNDLTITGDVTDESDNCATGLDAVYKDIITAGNCPGSYIINRKWTLVDNCDNVATALQIITIQDTTAPIFNVALPSDIIIECDTIPDVDTITATDNCGEASVTVAESTTVGSCDNEFTLIRTWTATDDCGNETIHTQTISVQDTTAPSFNEALPTDLDAECDAVPTAETLTASDTCSSTNVTFEETITEGACIGDYIIERTWSAIDSCGNEAVHTQFITVQDTTAPTLVTPFDENITVACDDIPGVPDLVFEDACSNNISVDFNEISTQVNEFEDYSIIRTWTINDNCGNESQFVQTISVEISNVINVFDANLCILDTEFDLFDLLSGDFDMNGNWSVVSGNTSLNGSFFDPTLVDEIGTYTFMYSITEGPCPTEVKVNVTLDDDCVVLACGLVDVEISKTVTANGDSYNEFFTISGIEDCGFVIELQIFNRWGAEIYKNNNYQNNWNGDAHGSSVGNSGKVPTGTYYYIINLRNSGLEPFAGPIYVATK